MVNLHNIDCLEFMRSQPDKSFDLAIVDPLFDAPAQPIAQLFDESPASAIAVEIPQAEGRGIGTESAAA